MTKDQITHLKSVFSFNKDGKPLAYSTTAILNDHNALNNMKDMLIWDDSHELAIGVKVNEDQHSQTIAPIKVTACSYQELFFLDSIYSTENFEIAVDKLFSFLSADQRKSMKEWAKKIPVQGNKIDRHVPYYSEEIDIRQDLNTPNMRSKDPIITMSTVNSDTHIQSLFDNLEDTNVVLVRGDCAVDNLEINKSCIYRGSGSNIIASKVNITAKEVEFDSIQFKGRSIYADKNINDVEETDNFITIDPSCKYISFKNCIFDSGSNIYNSLIRISGDTKVNIDNCIFGLGTDKYSLNRTNYYINIDKFIDGSKITFCTFHGYDIAKASIKINGIDTDAITSIRNNKWYMASNGIILCDETNASSGSFVVADNRWVDSSSEKGGLLRIEKSNKSGEFNFDIELIKNVGPGVQYGSANRVYYTADPSADDDSQDFSSELKLTIKQ